MAINSNVISAKILTPDGNEARFTVSIFGISTKEFFKSPGGGRPIREALLEQRDYQGRVSSKNFSLEEAGYSSSMFMVREVHPDELQPPKPVYRFAQRKSGLADEFE